MPLKLRGDADGDTSRRNGRCIGTQMAVHRDAVGGTLGHALKGQKLLAQGNALGFKDVANTPCKGKSFIFFA